jgi:hypothetical protein
MRTARALVFAILGASLAGTACSSTIAPGMPNEGGTSSGSSPGSMDGVHPNNTTGSQKMAAKWYAALAPLF